jgi:transposase
LWLEQPEASTSGYPAERGSHPALEGRALAPDQKKAVAEGRTLVFAAQSGFYLLPGKVRTYAPVAQTPVIRAPLSRDHLSAMGGITPEGKLYLMVQERAYCGADVVGFLKHLGRHVAGKLLVLWDGAPIHRSRVVKEYLSNGGACRIHLEQFPGYAPELNPAEGIWNYLKRVELKNLCCQSISHLSYELTKAKERLRHKTSIILGCIKQTGLY